MITCRKIKAIDQSPFDGKNRKRPRKQVVNQGFVQFVLPFANCCETMEVAHSMVFRPTRMMPSDLENAATSEQRTWGLFSSVREVYQVTTTGTTLTTVDWKSFGCYLLGNPVKEKLYNANGSKIKLNKKILS